MNSSLFVNSIGMKFVLIPSGIFGMGDDSSSNARPRHEVRISRPFYLGKYPVTQAQWTAVMGRGLFGLFGQNNPSYFKGADRPVENVSWNDAQEFIRKLNAKEGHNRYRLPTEAEWEYACRAGSTGRYCFGNDENRLDVYAWYSDNSGDATHPVGQKKPNVCGLYDMHGNVWEWVQDWFGGYYSDSMVDPQGRNAGENRVVRGGSWYLNAWFCQSASRDSRLPGIRAGDCGFRLALSLEH